VIRGIVFDLFDTLVDQDLDRLALWRHAGRRITPSTLQIHEHARRVAGLEIAFGDFVDLQREVDRRLRAETLDLGVELPSLRRFVALAERLGLEDAGDLAQSWTSIHMASIREALTVPSHHESVLAALAIEYRLGLCSNFSHAETAREILDESGLGRHLTGVVVSEEVGLRKPRPEIFAAVAESLGLASEEILHVGDSLRADVAGAAASGMRTVWLTRRIGDPEGELADFDGRAPDFALEDLMDLPVLLARLAGAEGRS
jgi:HAD superfamily hydrolase (TIGR01549 family)